MAALAQDLAWASLDAVREWWGGNHPRDVTTAGEFPPLLGAGLSIHFDDGATYEGLVTKATETSTAMLYTVVVFKDEPEVWERLFLDPKEQDRSWRVVWTPPEPEELVEETEPPPFERTATTVRLEALCWVYESADLFQSMEPLAVLGDLERAAAAAAGTGGLALPSAAPVSLTSRTHAGALSVYDVLRVLVRGGGAVVFLHGARCVYGTFKRAEGGVTMQVFEAEAERVLSLSERHVVALLRRAYEYVRTVLNPDATLSACVSVDAAAALTEPAFHEYWSTRLPAYHLMHRGISTCDRCGYAFRTEATCAMCGGADPPSDDEAAARHHAAGKVHLPCATVVPAFGQDGTPSLRCPVCNIVEPGDEVGWMPAAQRQRYALERFVPTGLERPQRWYCRYCYDERGAFVLVSALNQQCPSCGAFGT